MTVMRRPTLRSCSPAARKALERYGFLRVGDAADEGVEADDEGEGEEVGSRAGSA